MTFASAIEPRSVSFTAALALWLLGRAASVEDAKDQARRLWRERPKGRFAAA
jgi:hypothetical protein